METYADATVKRTYDSAGRPVQTVDTQSGAFARIYDLVGRGRRRKSALLALFPTRGMLTEELPRGRSKGSLQPIILTMRTETFTSAALGSASVTRTYDARNLPTGNTRSNGVAGSYAFLISGRTAPHYPGAGRRQHALFAGVFAYDPVSQIVRNALDTGLPFFDTSLRWYLRRRERSDLLWPYYLHE